MHNDKVSRESVDEVLEIVGTYGPWGPDINESLRFQIVLAEEVKALRGIKTNLSLQSIVEWASSWVPESNRARFADALKRELAVLTDHRAAGESADVSHTPGMECGQAGEKPAPSAERALDLQGMARAALGPEQANSATAAAKADSAPASSERAQEPVDPDSEAANPVWDLVLTACHKAWPEKPKLFYSQSPTELIIDLINERDEARKERDQQTRFKYAANERADAAASATSPTNLRAKLVKRAADWRNGMDDAKLAAEYPALLNRVLECEDIVKIIDSQ